MRARTWHLYFSVLTALFAAAPSLAIDCECRAGVYAGGTKSDTLYIAFSDEAKLSNAATSVTKSIAGANCGSLVDKVSVYQQVITRSNRRLGNLYGLLGDTTGYEKIDYTAHGAGITKVQYGGTYPYPNGYKIRVTNGARNDGTLRITCRRAGEDHGALRAPKSDTQFVTAPVTNPVH